MTNATGARPTIRYIAQSCDEYCLHPCGCKFHVRQEHFSGGKEWTPGKIYQHCEDLTSAKQAALALNHDAGWESTTDGDKSGLAAQKSP